jgi:hypothetical protein
MARYDSRVSTPKSKTITYVLAIEGVEHRFDVEIERPSTAKRGSLPVWTALEHERCPNCPLPLGDDAACPPAADLAPVVDRFSQLTSIARANVRVETPEREVRKETDAQTALSALMGVIMATSGCPILRRLKPLATMHLPFATAAETIHRTLGVHLVRALIDGKPADIEELRKYYDDVETLNFAFMTRLRTAASKDASLNALVVLQANGALVSVSLEDGMRRVRSMYAD